MERITSASNQKIKDIAELAVSRRFRRKTGLFVVEGAMLAVEAARSSCEIRGVFYTDAAYDVYSDAIDMAAAKAESVYLISEKAADKASVLLSSQQIFTLIEMPLEKKADALFQKSRVILLDCVQDPGNLGSIARSALAFGFDGLAVSSDSADWLSGKAQRASMGALLHTDVVVGDTLKTIAELRKNGFTVYAAALTADAVGVDGIDVCGRIALVIGNESGGLSKAVTDSCDASVMIPSDMRMRSLNAAAAASVLMFCLRHTGDRV